MLAEIEKQKVGHAERANSELCASTDNYLLLCLPTDSLQIILISSLFQFQSFQRSLCYSFPGAHSNQTKASRTSRSRTIISSIHQGIFVSASFSPCANKTTSVHAGWATQEEVIMFCYQCEQRVNLWVMNYKLSLEVKYVRFTHMGQTWRFICSEICNILD